MLVDWNRNVTRQVLSVPLCSRRVRLNCKQHVEREKENTSVRESCLALEAQHKEGL